jgi:two-component sensor histidine kinase
MGLCRFEPKTGNTTNYTIEDGLISNEFNRKEFCKGPDGTLYFSGPSGDTWFNPEDFYSEGKASPIYFNELRIGNKPVEFSNLKMGSFQLKKPIEQMEKLEFTHDQSMITIGFALMDLTNPEVNRFRYKMEGFDKEWLDAGKFSEATYTNLSPGEYTFKVIGCNSRKVWNTEPKTLAISIFPPWWGTWWFRVLMVLFVGGMIYVLYRYRLQQALKMMRLRDKIALDLHDEIGSSLNSIAFFGEAAKRMLPEGEQANQVISRINDKSKEIMESMSDIVWSLNSRNDSFDNIFNRLQSFAFQMLEPQGCQIEFDIPEQNGDTKLGMEERKNLYLLIKEAINNAAKYANCTELQVRVENKNHSYQIEVRDNGKGFDPEKTLRGNGLMNMHKRAEALGADFKLESVPGTGTRILVELKFS